MAVLVLDCHTWPLLFSFDSLSGRRDSTRFRTVLRARFWLLEYMLLFLFCEILHARLPFFDL